MNKDQDMKIQYQESPTEPNVEDLRKSISVISKITEPMEPDDVDSYLKIRDADERLTRIRKIIQAWEAQQKEDRKLRGSYANKLIWIFIIELVAVFISFLLIGLRILIVEEWTARVFILSVFVQTAGLILIIVKYLFPEKGPDFLRFFGSGFSDKDP